MHNTCMGNLVSDVDTHLVAYLPYFVLICILNFVLLIKNNQLKSGTWWKTSRWNWWQTLKPEKSKRISPSIKMDTIGSFCKDLIGMARGRNEIIRQFPSALRRSLMMVTRLSGLCVLTSWHFLSNQDANQRIIPHPKIIKITRIYNCYNCFNICGLFHENLSKSRDPIFPCCLHVLLHESSPKSAKLEGRFQPLAPEMGAVILTNFIG